MARSLFYGAAPTDGLVLGAVALLLIVIALPACWLPSRRAAYVDPAEAARCG